MRLLFVTLVSFITALFTVNASIQNGILTNVAYQYLYPNTPLYTCVYSGLWCSCYSNNNGGCSVGCSPSAYYTLHNKTSCPQMEDFMLAGFTLQ